MEPATPTTGTPPDDASLDSLGGRCVGNSYILIRPIGHGATGTVWRAVDRTSGEQVAVKLLREDLVRQPKLVTRFVQERAILLMLRHRHIVRVRDLLTVGDSLGLVMDLVDGGSLRGYLAERGTLTTSDAAGLLGQVAAALAEAHRLGVVHRDLKPDNILVHRDADGPDTRLTDFGIARVLDSPGVTTPGALLGTPNYVAPEAINGARPSPAADVYALGVLLYELITGRAPYAGGPPAAILRRHIEESPHRYPGIPDVAWTVIESCMAKEPADRPTAAQLMTTLGSLARATVGVPALPLAQPTPRLAEPDDEDDDELGYGLGGPHPSLPVPAPAPRRPLNRVRTWRWARPGAVVALVIVTLLGLDLPGLDPWRLLHTDQARPPSAAPSPVAPRASASPGPVAPVPTGPNGSAVAAAAAVSAGPARIEATTRVYGPWQCTENYEYETGHPVLAKPCYATGFSIRLLGHMQALPGVQADVSLSIQDPDSGATVSGPYTCPGLMFTDFAPEHDCGPFDLTDVPHGRRYQVVQSWTYTGRGLLPGGSAKGPLFRW